jgi:hypothetical protein
MSLDDLRDEHGEGDIGLKKLGHVLLGYVAAMGGHVRLPGYLSKEERPDGTDTCRACARRVPGGTFTLRRREDGAAVTLPFLAVHALASHGGVRWEGVDKGGEAPVGELVDLLGYEVYTRGKILSRYLSHTVATPAHLTIAARPERGAEICADCGEPVNLGGFVLENIHTGATMELRFMAVHAMAWHKDRAFRGSLHKGEVDLAALRAIMDHSEVYAALGRTLQSWLRGAGGRLPVPARLTIEEHASPERETCPECKAETSTGVFALRDAITGSEVWLPYFAVHALAVHGDAYFKGSMHQGWVDMARLSRIVG